MKSMILLSIVGVLFVPCIGWADTFGSGSNQFIIDFVTISDAMNPATGYGIVTYDYRMGKYEITNDQWDKFKNLNGIPNGNPTTAYNSSSGFLGAGIPTNNVSWYEAAQFVNWLNTSSGHQAAYKFTGTPGTSNYALTVWDLTDDGYNASNPYRNSNAHYFLPTEDEWVKAAYWNGIALQSYSMIDNQPPDEGQDSNFDMELGKPWNIGTGSEELHGTYDMMGNVWEWMESSFDNDYLPGSNHTVRGGSWYDGGSEYDGGGDFRLCSVARYSRVPDMESNQIGFRVASKVPFSLLSPNGGEIFEAMVTTEVTWEFTGYIDQILLEYSTNNGTEWTTIETVMNTGSYQWTIPDIVSDQCLIRISDAAHSSVNDASDSVFSIRKYEWYSHNGHQYALTLKHSNWVDAEAEAVAIGAHLVTINDQAEDDWLIDTSSNPFGLQYGKDRYGNWMYNVVWIGLAYIGGDKTLTSSWVWQDGEPIGFWNPHVQAFLPKFDGIHWYINGCDPSRTYKGQWAFDDAFDINPINYPRGIIEYVPKVTILTPKPGDFVPNRSQFTISWKMETKLPIPQVKIELSLDNGSTWELIDQVDNTGSYLWSIPDIISDQCILRISDPLDPAYKSTVPFAIGRSPRVYFADANLKLAVETALGITNPTYDDMLKLTYLNAKSKGITSLIGLETALNLTTLYLHQNTISDISPLTGLNKLMVLNLYLNNITNISPLSGLTKLYSLAISSNKITDISVLAGLNNLIYLYINNNQINDFSALTGNTKFKEIYATRNAVLTKETYLTHIPTIRAKNPNLTVFQYDPGCKTLRKADANDDCRVNLMDLAVIASDWLTCNHIYEEMCP